jgi:hypothetical protein
MVGKPSIQRPSGALRSELDDAFEAPAEQLRPNTVLRDGEQRGAERERAEPPDDVTVDAGTPAFVCLSQGGGQAQALMTG